MDRQGVSLVELLVVLVLASLIASAVTGLLVTQVRVHSANVNRFAQIATLRDAAAIFSAEVRELNVTDSSESDVDVSAPGTLRYKAMRTMGFVCASPDTLALAVTTAGPWIGVRALDENTDSVLVFAGGDVTVASDDVWLHGDARHVSSGWCNDGTTGLRVDLANVSRPDLRRVHVGAPVRGFTVMEIRAYRDARGQWWAGMRRFDKVGGAWPATQPVFGPLDPPGLEYHLFDDAGSATSQPAVAAGLEIAVHPFVGGPNARGRVGALPRIRLAFRNRGR
jgi:prepilin-type N-terminal cleavage/methylation domain-containing protein